MPRHARKKSESGIYHIMFRGINKQNIFEEPEDYKKALELLSEAREKSEAELYAYCFMPNHIHLLLKEGKKPIGETFKTFGTKYAYWYNTKYSRVGHLFQDRFKSEPVEDTEYFCVALRYILQNPIKAGLSKNAADYSYSSFRELFSDNGLTDRKYINSLKSVDEWRDYINEESLRCCMDIAEANPLRLTEEQALTVFRKTTKCESSTAFQKLSLAKRDKMILKLKQKGLSVRQISRLTGLTYYIIQKAQ